jgi:hypothetical protein
LQEKLTKEQLVDLVRKIMNLEFTEEQLGEMIDLLSRNTYPGVSDLIYYSKEQLTPGQIVDQALAYKPLITPPPLQQPL